jgi:light-regulated signal transduction histidine kinase (bacteriophytochrome)
METGEPAEFELTPENQDHWPETQGSWSSKAAPIRDESGVIIGAVEVAYNITDRKAAEKALWAAKRELEDKNRRLEAFEKELQDRNADLERSNRDLERFAHSASHDLQEPLRKVQAFGTHLAEECRNSLSAEGRQDLEYILDATERMRGLINDLLTYSRVATQGKAFVIVNLNGTIRDVLSDLELLLREAGGTVDVAGLPTIEADPIQMRQLFQNLIGNGLKFVKPGIPPRVNVRAETLPGEARRSTPAADALCRIVVEDNGIGFEQKYAERIFGMFQRLHQRREYPGTGIGLAVCRRIVERHGGTIEAEGRPGEGAKFILCLPLRHDSNTREKRP